MKKKSLVPLLFMLLVGSQSFSQQKSDMLITIDGKNISVNEFETIYKKNNAGTNIDKKSIQEYLDLYINFKLKVREAELLGLDTTESFKKELSGYRRQLAQPYLTDNDFKESLVREAYERMKFDVNASHILVKIPGDASPADTLAAWKEIQNIRKKIKSEKDFNDLVKKLPNSGDAQANTVADNLGYFTVFQMVYPFETAAFTTEPGKISDPVRTRFGYHLVFVKEKRNAIGEIKAAHIMIRTDDPNDNEKKDDALAKKKIDEIYQKLKKGEDFEMLARNYSDDKGTSTKGGELPPFGVGRMVPDFEKAAFGLQKDGDFSEPVKTDYGWHIVKRLGKTNLADYESLQKDLKAKIERDGRAMGSRQSFINKLKKEYNLVVDYKKRDEFYKVMDTSFYSGNWTAEKAKSLKSAVFTLTDDKYSMSKKIYNQQDFAQYLEKAKRYQRETPNTNLNDIVNLLFENWIDDSIIEFEDANLEKKHPEFNVLMNEYRDGILLFELMDQKVWTKAVKDTAGLKEFYEKNKMNNMWNERVNAYIYICSNDAVVKKTAKHAKKQLKKSTPSADILKAINTDSSLDLKIEEGKYQKGDNAIIDKVIWKKGLTKAFDHDGKKVMVGIKEVLPTQPKTLLESRGIVTAEYQNHLEQLWIKDLREKFKVSINNDALNQIK